MTLTVGGEPLRADLENLSAGGAKLVAAFHRPLGSPLTEGMPLRLTVEVGGQVLGCEAEVRWVEVRSQLWTSRLLLGVRFLQPGEEWGNYVQELIQRYMDEIEPVLM